MSSPRPASSGPPASPPTSAHAGGAGTTEGPRRVTEVPGEGALPVVGVPEWRRRFPWLIQGVTLRSGGPGDAEAFDLGLASPAPTGEVLRRWEELRLAVGLPRIVVSRQVHGSVIRVARGGESGLLLTPPADGHLTRDAGVLLTISVADCVPIFLLEPKSRTLGLLHAGWRGVAAGIVEEGLDQMGRRFGVEPRALIAHLGPAISGPRYPVGPEVHEALGLPVPSGSAPLDLREVVVRRLEARGMAPESIGISTLCVHDDPRFFSHRGGDAGRQIALLGYRGRPGVRS